MRPDEDELRDLNRRLAALEKNTGAGTGLEKRLKDVEQTLSNLIGQVEWEGDDQPEGENNENADLAGTLRALETRIAALEKAPPKAPAASLSAPAPPPFVAPAPGPPPIVVPPPLVSPPPQDTSYLGAVRRAAIEAQAEAEAEKPTGWRGALADWIGRLPRRSIFGGISLLVVLALVLFAVVGNAVKSRTSRAPVVMLTLRAGSMAAPSAPAGAPAELEKLAAAGDSRAALAAGIAYADGTGVPADAAKAARLFSRAAAAGEAVAQYRLALLYEEGRGVPRDLAKAAAYYRAAAMRGNRSAMHNLAVAYAAGAGVPRDYALAARWFQKAATLGLGDSEFNLAVLFEHGLGLPFSPADAYKWYAVAAAQGDGEAAARMKALDGDLDPDARAAALSAAAAFKPASPDPDANVPPSPADFARAAAPAR